MVYAYIAAGCSMRPSCACFALFCCADVMCGQISVRKLCACVLHSSMQAALHWCEASGTAEASIMLIVPGLLRRWSTCWVAEGSHVCMLNQALPCNALRRSPACSLMSCYLALTRTISPEHALHWSVLPLYLLLLSIIVSATATGSRKLHRAQGTLSDTTPPICTCRWIYHGHRGDRTSASSCAQPSSMGLMGVAMVAPQLPE